MFHPFIRSQQSQESQQKQQIQHEESSSHKGSESSDRPPIRVEARGIGPVTSLHENDVLCGRGGRINGHYGNIQFRRFCSEKRDAYFRKGIKKIEKAHIAVGVVQRIRSLKPAGRFLKQDSDGWYDIGDAKAMTKVGQAVREHTPKVEPADEMTSPSSEQHTDELKPQPAFRGPLYPGYHPFEMRHTGQNTAAAFHSRNHESPDLSYPLHPDKRLSIISAVSGISRVSALMRESVQSDLSDGVSAGPPCMGGTSAPLRLSLYSDISDCMSMMSLDDHRNRRNVNRSLKTLEGSDIIGATACPVPARYNQTPSQDGTQPDFPSKSTPQEQAARQRRRGSVFSMSIASNFSFRSFGSCTSLSLS